MAASMVRIAFSSGRQLYDITQKLEFYNPAFIKMDADPDPASNFFLIKRPKEQKEN
jgi:hypothetical protein